MPDEDRDDPRDEQRPVACPSCGASDHFHRRTSGPVHEECAAVLARALVLRLRAMRTT